jgi:hypothetical protein
VLSQPSRGRLLLVLQSDAPQQLKKVQELCSFVERAHGMPLGWLLSAPRAQVRGMCVCAGGAHLL